MTEPVLDSSPEHLCRGGAGVVDVFVLCLRCRTLVDRLAYDFQFRGCTRCSKTKCRSCSKLLVDGVCVRCTELQVASDADDRLRDEVQVVGERRKEGGIQPASDRFPGYVGGVLEYERTDDELRRLRQSNRVSEMVRERNAFDGWDGSGRRRTRYCRRCYQSLSLVEAQQGDVHDDC